MTEKKDTKTYNKEYYEKNKDKMKKQMTEAQLKRRLTDLLNKLNENNFKRFPHSKLEKFNIKFDEINKKYYI